MLVKLYNSIGQFVLGLSRCSHLEHVCSETFQDCDGISQPVFTDWHSRLCSLAYEHTLKPQLHPLLQKATKKYAQQDLKVSLLSQIP